jgi:exopolyphosphatase/guanosine-5'-triphosphate,3'-diphosphate pyrophosphatase
LSGRYAVVSIGTNSTRALLADVTGDVPRVALARSIGTRIGEGLGEAGQLGDEPIKRTLAAVSQLQRAIRGRYVRLLAIATSALRRAKNADAFITRVTEILGVPVRVLTGEEEATASYRGAVSALRLARGERVGVLDIGGGSTEYAFGTAAIPDGTLSCEIGAVRLTEAVPALGGGDGAVPKSALERARSLAAEALEPLRGCDPVDRMVLVGGTATTIAAVVRGAAGAVANYRLTRADLAGELARLTGLDIEARKTVPGMQAQRADILPGGIVIIDTALDLLRADAAVATSADLLLGVLLEAHDAERPAGGRPPARAGHEASRGHR